MDDPFLYARAWLDFVPPLPEHYLHSFAACYQRGARSVRLDPLNETSRLLADQIAQQFGPTVRINTESEGSDCRILLETDAEALSAQLHALLDVPCQVIAPITSRYYQQQSNFLLTVPKAGTHLLYELMCSFQIGPSGVAAPLRAGHWHCLLHDHPHTPAVPFFQELANHPRGGIDHPFFAHPAIFLYRNPMDVVVSETYYLARKERTPLAHFYASFSESERCLSLITDDPLTSGIRDRVRGYVAWSHFPNVIPISFEELIGSNGGGSDEAQQRTIWSLQLKLHVPGNPQKHGASIFNSASPTFRQGNINSHRAFFRAEHYQAFRCLNQDFMHELGYDVDDAFEPGYLPRLVEPFRRRPLRLQRASSL